VRLIYAYDNYDILSYIFKQKNEFILLLYLYLQNTYIVNVKYRYEIIKNYRTFIEV